MRWNKKQPQDDSSRFICKFAWFPVTIGLETRWLEWVYIKQVYLEDSWYNLTFVYKEEVL